jgi:superfamily II DNA or RNA helicase
MSFIKTIGQKFGSTIAPVELPAIHDILIPRFNTVVYDVPVSKFNASVHGVPVARPNITVYRIFVPRPAALISKNLISRFGAIKILTSTNPTFSPSRTGSNLLPAKTRVEIKSTFSALKPVDIRGFEFAFDTACLEGNFETVDQPKVSENLCEKFEGASVHNDLPAGHFDFQAETKVSENLFKLLLPQKINGKDYDKKNNQLASQQTVFPAKAAAAGFRKAYKREKAQNSTASYITQSLTFWDLLYPVLLPPLVVNFKSKFELFRPLFKFQPAGIEFLVKNQSALLADEMGTGKTVMSAVALKLLFRLGKAKKALIVCPVSLLKTWQDHLSDWASELELTVVRGTPEVRKLDWKYNAHVYLTTYDTVASDFLTKIKKQNKFDCPNCKTNLNLGSKITLGDENMPKFFCPVCRFALNKHLIKNLPKKASIVDPELLNSFDVVLIDEAQYIKNKSSDRSRAVRLLKSEFRWALTGTPIENSLEDLVSIFSFVKPDLFKNEYLSPKRAAELIKPYFLRRLKKNVMKHLPPKVRQEIWLELDSEQLKAYKAAEQQGVQEIEALGERVTKVHIFSLITKLKQICNFAPSREKSAKTQELLDLIEQIKESGQKVIVFSQYDIEGVSKLQKLLQPFGVSLLKGGMSDAARNSAIDAFKKDPNICVFLATIKAGGVGLTLTEASYVIHFDHWWNPALMWQADDRVHRSGQKSSQVNIYSFWMQDTIEERIHAILKEKGLLFDAVVNGLSVDVVDEMISTEEWLGILGIKTSKLTNSFEYKKTNGGEGANQQKQQQKISTRHNQRGAVDKKEKKQTESADFDKNANFHKQQAKQNSLLEDLAEDPWKGYYDSAALSVIDYINKED